MELSDKSKFSVKSGAEHYEKKEDTIKKALQRGGLKGHKDIFGCWWFYKKDGDEYFYGPALPDWIRLEPLLICFGLSRYLVGKVIDDGTIEAKCHKRIWYVNLYSWNRYLVSIRMIRINIDESSFREFKTKNSITAAEAADICKIANENRRVIIYLWWKGNVWACWSNKSIIHLIKLEISIAEEIRISVCGNGANQVSNLVYEKLAT